MNALVEHVGGIVRRTEIDQRSMDFCNIARLLMLGKGSWYAAKELADERHALPRIREVLKAVTQAGNVGGWGAQLAPFELVAQGFLSSLRNYGIFDRALPSMRQVPLHTTVGMVTVGASGGTVAEANLKPISRLNLTNGQLVEMKAVCILTVTDDLLKNGGPLAARLFAEELAGAVAVETDRSFLGSITTGVSPIGSSGTTATAITQDIQNAIGALSLGAASKVFLAVDTATAKLWALQNAGNGPMFPGMGIGGGVIANDMQVVVTDAVNAQIVAFDAAQCAGGTGSVELDASNQASLQLDSLPDSPPTGSTLVQSLWQMNMTGLKAVRFFGAQKLGTRACSVISNAAGDSPA